MDDPMRALTVPSFSAVRDKNRLRTAIAQKVDERWHPLHSVHKPLGWSVLLCARIIRPDACRGADSAIGLS